MNNKKKGLINYSINFDSKDIKFRIYEQISNLLEFSILNQDTKEKLYEVRDSIYHKLIIFKYHLIKYRYLESKYRKELYIKFRSDHVKKNNRKRYFFEFPDLTAHFEAILFQSKATLDVLIKLLNPIYENYHPQLKQLKTFGDKGEKVLRVLNKYYENSKPEVKQKLEHLIKLLEKERDETKWLILLIDARDSISHYKKNEMFAFQIDLYIPKDGNIKIDIIPPRESKNQTTREFLNIIRYNLLTFCEDFIAVALRAFLIPILGFFIFKNHMKNPIYYPKWYIAPKDLPVPPKQFDPNAFMQLIISDEYSHLDSKKLFQLYSFYHKFGK